MWCDELEEADALYTRTIDDARRNGTPVGLSTALGLRALVRRRTGALASADADATEAIRLADELDLTPPLLPAALATGALVGLERNAPRDQLEQIIARPTDPDGAPSGLLFHARGRVLAGLGDLEGGLEQVLEAGRFDESIGIRNPAVLEWRSDAARLHAALGQGDRARALAEVELERARAFGAARAIGIALSALAATHSAEQQVGLLRESVETLSGSPDRLEEARARVELGAALRRTRKIAEARVELSAGLDAAHRCGATRLAGQALDELRAAGAKPRRTAVSGVEALTASERRVAELAATGSTNRTIAQQLFVSEKTVETHLSHAYDKLGVRSRAALPELLASA
jgi:DNA-binding NarL/FixJ family response regulator